MGEGRERTVAQKPPTVLLSLDFTHQCDGLKWRTWECHKPLLSFHVNFDAWMFPLFFSFLNIWLFASGNIFLHSLSLTHTGTNIHTVHSGLNFISFKHLVSYCQYVYCIFHIIDWWYHFPNFLFHPILDFYKIHQLIANSLYHHLQMLFKYAAMPACNL